MLNHGQALQYFCSKCNSSLIPTTEVDFARITEACPCCGYSLAETLQTSRPVREKLVAPQLQTVHDVSVLTFDLKPLDDFFLGFRAGDALCITGPAGNLIACRLCVRAMLCKKRAGLESPVLFIDAGNNSDVYQCVDFARQYGLDVAKVLNGIMVSRAFTVYQLAGLLIHELHSAVRQLGAKLVVISGLLAMFTQDPQGDQAEARQLLREMLSAVRKVAGKVTVVITADSLQGYEDIVKFDSRLEAADPVKIFASTSRRSKVLALPPKALRLVAR
jgi:hypothetical protein